MPTIKQIAVTNFFGGISDDARKSTATEFTISKHFDIFSSPNRLIPYRSLETDTETSVSATDLKQYFVKDFVYASASSKFYGLGQTGAGLTKIVEKANAISGLWTLPATSEGNGAVKSGSFLEYKDYLWGFQGTTQVFRWGLLSGTPSITNSHGTVATITSVAQSVIASDGNMYMAYNNNIVRVSTALVVTDAVISVPTNFKITSICNYGKYLAIGCAPISTFNGTSKVYLWNLSSDLFQDTIDWGEGELRVLETVEGYLVGITDRYLNIDTGAGAGSMIVQTYSGGVPQVVKEISTLKIVGKTMPISKAVKNNRLFWAAKIMTNSAGTEYNEGIWSFGRKNAQYPWAITLDLIDENVSTSGIQSFGTAGNFFFISHSSDGSVDKTNDAATYAFTSVYESQIVDFGDANITKQLIGVSVTSAAIPSNGTTSGTVTVKYKTDIATSWTTIGSYTSSLSAKYFRDFINIESTGDSFASAKEYRFRIESTGGQEITGFKIKVQMISEPN